MFCPQCGNYAILVHTMMHVRVTLIGKEGGQYDVDETWPNETNWFAQDFEQAECTLCFHHATVRDFAAVTEPPTKES